tara:strand:- start:938 stop:1366 length:429 start_codon:yes stop_codon:yes gene_type:complete
MNKLLTAVLLTSSLTANANPWDSDLNSLRLDLTIQDGNNVLMLFDTMSQMQGGLRVDISDAVTALQDDINLELNNQRDAINAGAAASLAAANAIRSDNGLRAGVGYYNDEAALSIGGRFNSLTTTLTIDTGDNISAGIGFDF